MSISPFLSVAQPCNQVLSWACEQLTRAGLCTVQTFNLHAVLAGAHECSCPNHGTSECDCQMIILLVYGKAEAPLTLILHGNDGQTWLSLAETPISGANGGLGKSIRQALAIQIP